MPETIEITYIKNAIDSIKERLDTIEKRLEITKIIATAMMNRDIKEAAEQERNREYEKNRNN